MERTIVEPLVYAPLRVSSRVQTLAHYVRAMIGVAVLSVGLKEEYTKKKEEKKRKYLKDICYAPITHFILFIYIFSCWHQCK